MVPAESYISAHLIGWVEGYVGCADLFWDTEGCSLANPNILTPLIPLQNATQICPNTELYLLALPRVSLVEGIQCNVTYHTTRSVRVNEITLALINSRNSYLQ